MKMKQLLFTIVAMMLWGLTASAAISNTPDFREDGIWYSINDDDVTTVRVDWNGTMAYVGSGHGCYTGNVVVPQTVTHNGTTYTVTRIADYAFYFCNVNSVTLPSTIESIGQEAFRGTWNTELVLPSSLRRIAHAAFAESQILEIVIPSGVEELPNFAFRGAQLSKITLPSTVKRIGKECFFQSHLTKCTVPDGVERIEDGTFGESPLEEVFLPTTLKYIGNYAFKKTKISNVMLHEGIDSIGTEAFRESPIEQITLPTTVTYLGENAFRECANLSYVSMNCPGLKEIGQYTFYNCAALNQISALPDAVKSIGNYAFNGCAALENFEISPSSQLTSIGNSAFYRSGIYAVNIPTSTESIGERTFEECQNLEKVTFVANGKLKSIGRRAFCNAQKLKALSFPDATETIGEDAFGGCVALTNLKLPKNLSIIEKRTFYGCTSLAKVIFPEGSKLRCVGDESFYTCAPIDSLVFPEGLEEIGSRVYSAGYNQTGQLKYVYIPSTVKSIGNGPFSKYDINVHDIVFDIASSIDSVGEAAFCNAERINIRHYDSWVRLVCKSRPFGGSGFLAHVYIDGELVTDYIIPEEFTSIRDYAFCPNKDIRSVVLPNSIQTIGECAFSGCSSLQSVTLSNSVKTLGKGAFSDCNIQELHIIDADNWIRLVNNTTGYMCFEWTWFPNVVLNGEPMTEYVIPADITGIRQNCFSGNKQITSVTIKGPVEVIGAGAFQRCESLQTVILGDELTTIGSSAFWYCKSLSKISFGKSLNSIGSKAFYGCSINETNIADIDGWTRIVLNSTTDNFQWEWFPNVYYNGKLITDYVIPEGYTSIRMYAFKGNPNIQSVIFPNSLKTIGSWAFNGCLTLKKVTFGDQIETVQGFGGCTIDTVKVSNYDGWMEIVSNPSSGYSPSIFKNVFFQDKLVADYIIPEGTKAISKRQFINNDNIESITFPNSLESVGDEAFYGCKNLKTIVFDDSLTTIGRSAFRDCTALEKVHFGKSIVTFGQYAFEGCGVAETTVADYDVFMKMVASNFSWWWFPNVYYQGELITDFVLPEGITTLRSYAFDNNSTIKSIILPNSLKEIGAHAFKNRTTLKKVVFGDSIQIIRDYAFSGCCIDTVDVGNIGNWCNVTLEGGISGDNRIYSNPLHFLSGPSPLIVKGKEVNTLNIPAGTTRINYAVFWGLSRLERVTIPGSVKEIGPYAFYGCPDLMTIRFLKNSKLSSIGASAFRQTPISAIEFPDSLNIIGENAFRDCKALTSITIPGTLENISARAFYGCNNLTSVTLSEGVKTIGNCAFYECGISSIEIPASIQTIGEDAFGHCVTNIHIKDLASWCHVNFLGSPVSGFIYSGFIHYYLNGTKLEGELVIPDGVTKIGDFAFYGNTDFGSIVIPEGVKDIGVKSFCGISWIKSISLPSTIETIGNLAFGWKQTDIKYLDTQTISLHLKDLGSFIRANRDDGINYTYRFYLGYDVDLYLNGNKVVDLIIPEGITSMYNNTIRNFNITSVTLPSTLEYINDYALRNLSLLKYIYCRSKFAASGTAGLNAASPVFVTFYVPQGRIDHYKAKWPNVASWLAEAPETYTPSGTITLNSLTTELTAHTFVYDDQIPCLDLSDALIDEDVTAEVLQDIADRGTIIFLPESMTGITGTNIVCEGTTPRLVLRDSTDFAAPYDFTAQQLVHQRRFAPTGNGATSMCLPYNLDALPQGMKAFALTEQMSADLVRFTEVGSTEANMPYMVTTTIPVDSICVTNAAFKSTPTMMPDGGVENLVFRGTFNTISNDEAADMEAYILDDATRTWLSAYDNMGLNVVPGRAYLLPADGIDTPPLTCYLKEITPGVYLTGDVNGDGDVDIADAVCIVNHVVGKPNVVFNATAADANGDGDVDIADAVHIVNLIVGKISALARRFDYSLPEPQ